jgi:4'-phosphopantetheinyl transferase EntD
MRSLLMKAKSLPQAPRRPVWNDALVAQRTREWFHSTWATRSARFDYAQACKRFKARRGIEWADTKDPKFRRSTRKAYEAFLAARVAQRNALRRLETAVRRCPKRHF